MKAVKGNLAGGGVIYLATLALFLFFFISSAPHRVHHSFDQSHLTPCQAFSAAKGCHLQASSITDFSVARIASEWVVPTPETWIPYSTPSPFSIRAPPLGYASTYL